MPKVSLEDFTKAWEQEIARIDKKAMDDKAVNSMRLHYELNQMQFKVLAAEEPDKKDIYLKLELLQSKLEAALRQANSRFKLQNHGRRANAFSRLFHKPK